MLEEKTYNKTYGGGSGSGDYSADFSSMSFASHEFTAPWADSESQRIGLLRRTVDSFKRDRGRTVSVSATYGADGRVFDAEQAARATADSPLNRVLKGRHLQMIAFGGSIGMLRREAFASRSCRLMSSLGTGLFVNSGKSLLLGGPAAVIIGFVLIGIMLYCTMHALGEMAVAFPVAGSFSAYSTRFLDPAWGFAMGWNYAMQWLIALPLETVSATIIIGYWETGISNAVWVTILLLLTISINFFGVKGYGEAEFILSIIKVVAVVGFM